MNKSIVMIFAIRENWILMTIVLHVPMFIQIKHVYRSEVGVVIGKLQLQRIK